MMGGAADPYGRRNQRISDTLGHQDGQVFRMVGVDAELGRYRIQLDGEEGKPIKVKPDNVQLDATAYGIS